MAATRSVRLSDDEMERIQAAADTAGESWSAYVVRAALARAEGELGDEMTRARWRAIAEQVADALSSD